MWGRGIYFEVIRASAFCVGASCLIGMDNAGEPGSLWCELLKLTRPEREPGVKRRRLTCKGLPWPDVPELGRATFPSMPVSFDVLARRLKLIGFMGSGTFGKVYVAEDKICGERVAVKVVTDEDGQVASKELFILNRMQGHENIIRLRDGVCNPYWIAIVTDLAHTNLASYMKNDTARGGLVPPLSGGIAPPLSGGIVPTFFAAQILHQIACGLDHVHGRRVIHRDLHASNILLRRDGTAALCDFGISVFLKEDGDDAYKGRRLGGHITMAWVRAPEVWFADGTSFSRFPDGSWTPGRAVYGAGIDVWSWGMLGIQMAIGDSPLRARTEFLSAKLLLQNMVGEVKLPVKYKDVLMRAGLRRHSFRKGQWSGGPMEYILDRCITWDYLMRPTASVCAESSKMALGRLQGKETE